MKQGIIRSFMAGVRKAFTANLGLKAVAFCAALILVAYQRSQDDERTRTVAFNVDAQLPPASRNRELMTTIPPSIRVTVQGSTRSLEELSSSSNSLELDLRNGTVQYVRFTPDRFQLPPGTRIKAIEPPGLELEWQDVIKRHVPIQSSVTGVVAEGHEVAQVNVDPETIEVTGPKSLVNVIQSVRVAPFDITGLSTGVYQRQLALDPPPARTTYVDRANAEVTVEIRRRMTSANFSRLPVEVVGALDARTTPERVDVTVKGPPEVIRGLQPELVVPRVELAQLDTSKPGSAVVKVVVDLSSAETEVQPPTVKVSW